MFAHSGFATAAIPVVVVRGPVSVGADPGLSFFRLFTGNSKFSLSRFDQEAAICAPQSFPFFIRSLCQGRSRDRLDFLGSKGLRITKPLASDSADPRTRSFVPYHDLDPSLTGSSGIPRNRSALRWRRVRCGGLPRCCPPPPRRQSRRAARSWSAGNRAT